MSTVADVVKTAFDISARRSRAWIAALALSFAAVAFVLLFVD